MTVLLDTLDRLVLPTSMTAPRTTAQMEEHVLYAGQINKETLAIYVQYSLVNSLLPNDAIWCHDLCELSIGLWELYGALNTRRYTLVQGFCFFWQFLMGCKELSSYSVRHSTSSARYSTSIMYCTVHVVQVQCMYGTSMMYSAQHGTVCHIFPHCRMVLAVIHVTVWWDIPETPVSLTSMTATQIHARMEELAQYARYIMGYVASAAIFTWADINIT